MKAMAGKHLIGRATSAQGRTPLRARDPRSGEALEPAFCEATEEEINRALRLAEQAFQVYRRCDPDQRALFLERIAEQILELGDELIDRTMAETALPRERLLGERARTVGQIRMFAELTREGSWVGARIDRAQPERKPLPKPDIRRMLIPMGPVVVFGASNFPLAFSVAGGDTASALAAGNPVVVKAHPAHPGTSELMGRAILAAAEQSDMPEGIFSLLQGAGQQVGRRLVEHPLTQAVAFTGSLRGGRALFDVAAARPRPIPVFAEMGSINPVFVLPGALAERSSGIARGLVQSVTLGVGQFCTNPGLVVALEDSQLKGFVTLLQDLIAQVPPQTMLHRGILQAYDEGVERFKSVPGVSVVSRSRAEAKAEQTEAPAVCFATAAPSFLEQPALSEELFGPCTLLVGCQSPSELEQIASRLEGHLTATIHATAQEVGTYRRLLEILEQKVGRLIFNGFPTGVEVCPSMQHGGPYPATTDSHFTSVGTAAIERFARPICYQDFPAELLPVELRDSNEKGIWRLIDGQWKR